MKGRVWKYQIIQTFCVRSYNRNKISKLLAISIVKQLYNKETIQQLETAYWVIYERITCFLGSDRTETAFV